MAPLRRPQQLSGAVGVVGLVGGLVGLLAPACSSPTSAKTPPCVQGLTTDCQPLYAPPTFDTLYTKLFVPTCASGTGTCHTADAAKGGLVFATADDAYSRLVGGGRVTPGDPSCSLIMKRITSTDPSYHMPPGTVSLSGPEECAIVQWIAGGAKR